MVLAQLLSGEIVIAITDIYSKVNFDNS